MSLSTAALPGTALSITNLMDYQSRIYYQDTSNYVREIQYNDAAWTIDDSPIVKAAFDTPLAAISWNSGDNIHVFFLDETYTIQSMNYASTNPSWTKDGLIADLDLKVGNNSHLAAVQFFQPKGDLQLRLFYQDSNTNNIQTYANVKGNWQTGRTFTGVLSGSAISATKFRGPDPSDTLQIRVGYQAEDLSFREFVYSETSTGWADASHFEPSSIVLGHMPSNALLGWKNSAGTAVGIQTFWLNENRQITNRGYSGGWDAQPGTVAGPLTTCAQFCAAQFDSGTHLRVYYQTEDSSIIQEVRNDGSGWTPGTTITTANY